MATLDPLRDYWQCPLAEETRDISTIATPKGALIAIRIPQGVLKSTVYFYTTVQCDLDGLNSMAWVDSIVMCGTSSNNPLHTLDVVMGRVERVGLHAAARERILHDSIKWCKRRILAVQ